MEDTIDLELSTLPLAAPKESKRNSALTTIEAW